MTGDVAADPSRRPICRFVLALCILVGVAVSLCTPRSGVVHAAMYVYDVPAYERVDVHEIGADEAGLAQLGGRRDGSALHSATPFQVEGQARTSP